MGKRVVIFGAGHMGTAISLGLRARGHHDLHIIEPNENRRSFLRQKYNILTHPIADQLGDEDVMVLAMPPQEFSAFAKEHSLPSSYSGLVISVMAGIPIAALCKALSVNQIIRSIPNTPSEVFQGMTVYCASEDTTAQNRTLAEEILGSFGKTLCVSIEEQMDHATALCGGGPAFVAYFAGAMQNFATKNGFGIQDSALIISQVLRGTADLIEKTGKPAMQICNEVMTPQGTTERGIFHFEQNDLGNIVAAGLEKASARSKELRQLLKA